MPAQHLTDAFVRNVRLPRKDARPNQVMYLDTTERGWALQLVVSYGGSKTFRSLRYVNGKPHSVKLGTYPHMSVKQARDLARARYENPQKFDAEAEIGTFKEIADNWTKRYVEKNKLISADELKRHLDRYIYPKWKDRKLIEIDRGDVAKLIDGIEDRSGTRQADSVLGTIGQVMKWYQSRNQHYTSVVVPGMKRGARNGSRTRTLKVDEIRAVWSACDKLNSQQFGAIIRLALLTAQRREKISTMKWSDLDLDKGIWTIPKAAREKGHAELVKLPPLALSIIKSQAMIVGNPHVFAGSLQGRRNPKTKANGPPAFNSWSQRKSELDELLPKGMEPWTIHDLRRTARSLMSEAGVLPHIAERVMGHAIAGVEGIYDKHDYFEMKSKALTQLADKIRTIVNPRA